MQAVKHLKKIMNKANKIIILSAKLLTLAIEQHYISFWQGNDFIQINNNYVYIMIINK